MAPPPSTAPTVIYTDSLGNIWKLDKVGPGAAVPKEPVILKKP
jgi:hypothetical protein